MPVATSISIQDRESTPVTHVFTPRGKAVNSNVYRFVESSTAMIGDKVLTFSVTENATKVRVRLKITDPTLANEVVNGITVPKAVRTQFFDGTYTFDKTGTLQERKNLCGFVYNIHAPGQALAMSVITGLEPVYG